VAVFDKTGTLTIGRPHVHRVGVLDGWTPRDMLRLAGAVEQGSGHLLARSLVDAARTELGTAPLPVATGVEEAPGRGVRGHADARRVTVGARSYVAELEPRAARSLDALDARLGGDQGLRAYVAIDGEAAGVIEYADRIRDGLSGVLKELEALGYRRTVLLSGDHTPNVRAVATEVGIREAIGDLLPEGKVDAVKRLEGLGERVLMVGDGTNDAPALSSATVGVALAEHGGGITAEAADVVILVDDLARLPEAVQISRRTVRIARQSIGVGLGLSGVAMLFAAFGFIAPVLGALIQEAIDVAVILNALRTSR
jgi:P-type E1-E2 ATPase